MCTYVSPIFSCQVTYGISEQVSIYLEEISGQKRSRNLNEDDLKGCANSEKCSITK